MIGVRRGKRCSGLQGLVRKSAQPPLSTDWYALSRRAFTGNRPCQATIVLDRSPYLWYLYYGWSDVLASCRAVRQPGVAAHTAAGDS